MEPLIPKSTLCPSNRTISSTSTSRYGEPFYSERPMDDERGTWPLPPPPNSGKCYEELELERRCVNTTFSQSVSWVFGNPLSVLAGVDSTVEVIIGSTSWHLHRALLTSHSLLFKSALSEPSKRRVFLKDVFITDDTIFPLFVQWLYTSSFNAVATTDPYRAYRLGIRLHAHAFKNKAIHKLYAMNLSMCTFTPLEALNILLDTEAGDGLKRLVVDSIALGFLTQVLNPKQEEWELLLKGARVMGEVMASMARQHLQTWKTKKPEEYYDIV